MTEKDLMWNACNELAKVFGKEYLRANYEGTLEGHGMIDDDTFMLFVGMKTDDDLPGREANENGWVVYGKVLLDAHNGKLKKLDYMLE